MSNNNFIYMGIVEDRSDFNKLGRCKVRIMGIHTQDKEELPTDKLPWAYVMMPGNSAGVSGIGMSPVGPVEGSTVMVTFTDNGNCQIPIIMGTLNGIPQNDESVVNDKLEVTPVLKDDMTPDGRSIPTTHEESNAGINDNWDVSKVTGNEDQFKILESLQSNSRSLLALSMGVQKTLIDTMYANIGYIPSVINKLSGSVSQLSLLATDISSKLGPVSLVLGNAKRTLDVVTKGIGSLEDIFKVDALGNIVNVTLYQAFKDAVKSATGTLSKFNEGIEYISNSSGSSSSSSNSSYSNTVDIPAFTGTTIEDLMNWIKSMNLSDACIAEFNSTCLRDVFYSQSILYFGSGSAAASMNWNVSRTDGWSWLNRDPDLQKHLQQVVECFKSSQCAKNYVSGNDTPSLSQAPTIYTLSGLWDWLETQNIPFAGQEYLLIKLIEPECGVPGICVNTLTKQIVFENGYGMGSSAISYDVSGSSSSILKASYPFAQHIDRSRTRIQVNSIIKSALSILVSKGYLASDTFSESGTTFSSFRAMWNWLDWQKLPYSMQIDIVRLASATLQGTGESDSPEAIEKLISNYESYVLNNDRIIKKPSLIYYTLKVAGFLDSKFATTLNERIGVFINALIDKGYIDSSSYSGGGGSSYTSEAQKAINNIEDEKDLLEWVGKYASSSCKTSLATYLAQLFNIKLTVTDLSSIGAEGSTTTAGATSVGSGACDNTNGMCMSAESYADACASGTVACNTLGEDGKFVTGINPSTGQPVDDIWF